MFVVEGKGECSDVVASRGDLTGGDTCCRVDDQPIPSQSLKSKET